jgi:hypothetical protein
MQKLLGKKQLRESLIAAAFSSPPGIRGQILTRIETIAQAYMAPATLRDAAF